MLRIHVKMIKFAIVFVLLAGLGMFGAVLVAGGFASPFAVATTRE